MLRLIRIARPAQIRIFALLLLFHFGPPVGLLRAQSVIPGDHALFAAIRSGDSHLLDSLLTHGADPNAFQDGYSALMAATLNGTPEEMNMLISRGARVNDLNRDSVSALWLAIPDSEKTRLLLDDGADVQHRVQGYGILAKLSAIPGTLDLLRELLQRGADPKGGAGDNMVLFQAASSGDTALLGFLIRSGQNVNDTVAFGDYPLNSALYFRNFETAKMLVDHGANVNIHPAGFGLAAVRGFSPLMNAAWENERPSFFYLLNHGADPNQKSLKGFTALMMLELSEGAANADMTLALLTHGADPRVKAPDGMDALQFARRKGDSQSVELLQKYLTRNP